MTSEFASLVATHRAAFELCHRISSQAKSSFPIAFRLLPRDQRLGMTALYAWLRLTDDLADEPGAIAEKRTKLQVWRDALNGHSQPSEILPAFLATVRHFQIPHEHLHAVIDGVESDLEHTGFADFADLEIYCYRVASAVGLCCLAIWGVRDPAATQPAIDAGMAFQLTNILRDVGEDHRNGRIYLPRSEVPVWPPTREQLQFQIERARKYYQRSESLLPLLSPRPRSMFTAMSGIYRRLLDTIDHDPMAVMTRRVRVSGLQKMLILLRSVLRR